MRSGGKRIVISLCCLAGGVGILWAAIAVPPWIREERALARLGSPDIQVQNQAAEALAEMGSVKAIPAILAVMGRRTSVPNSTDNFNFIDLLDAIIERRGFEAVSPLIHELNSSYPNIRETACKLIGDLGSEARAAIPQLSELLQHPDFWTQLRAAQSLYEVGAEEESYLPALVHLSRDSKNRQFVLWTLWMIPHVEKRSWSIPGLMECLNDGTLQIVVEALGELGLLGLEASVAIPSVLEKARDPMVAVRCAALECLGSIGADRQEVRQFLFEALRDTEGRTRAAAAIGLWKAGPRAALAAARLRLLVEYDPHETVRVQAACALLRLEPEDLLAAKVARNARDPLVNWAISSLRGNRSDLFRADTGQAALLSMGIEDQQMRPFIDALKDPDRVARSRALYFFQVLGPAAKPVLSMLLEAATDPDRELRVEAIGAIGAIGPPAAPAIPLLKDALKARNAGIRYQARRALAMIEGS